MIKTGPPMAPHLEKFPHKIYVVTSARTTRKKSRTNMRSFLLGLFLSYNYTPQRAYVHTIIQYISVSKSMMCICPNCSGTCPETSVICYLSIKYIQTDMFPFSKSLANFLIICICHIQY